MSKKLSRRNFIKGAAATAGALALPRFAIGAPGGSANDKLNIAFIGVGGRGDHHIRYIEYTEDNIVAFCDVDDQRAENNYANHPDAPRFKDFREMLDKLHQEIDAVCISTPDHTHFAATYACMQLGLHVLTEKPLTHNIWQARTLRKAADYYKVITQMGNQGRATDGIRKVKEWYEAGVIGQVREVLATQDGPIFGKNAYFLKPAEYPPAKQPAPDTIDWELWRGPVADDIAYNEIYHPRFWRGFYSFGNGSLGDWACHTLDAPFWALDLGAPSVIAPKFKMYAPENFVPDKSILQYQFPARGDKAPCKLTWYEGDTVPEIDPEWGVDNWDGGMLMVGEKGCIATGQRPDNPRLYPEKLWEEFRNNQPPETYPRIEGTHVKEWLSAIRGEGPAPCSNFDYAAGLTELTLLGVLAQKTNSRIEWDAEKGEVTNKPELNRFVREPVRNGWESGEEVWKV